MVSNFNYIRQNVCYARNKQMFEESVKLFLTAILIIWPTQHLSLFVPWRWTKVYQIKAKQGSTTSNPNPNPLNQD